MKPTAALIILCSAALPSGLWAGDAGTSATTFLELGAGPRAVAMGDAQVAVADDAYATYWNPAGLASLHTQETAFAQNNYIQGISQEFAAYALPTQRYGSFGISVNYLGIGSFQGYDAQGAPAGSVSASDLALGLSYAHALLRDERYDTELSAGATGKYITETLAGVGASAYAGDLGLLFKPGIRWGEWLNGWKAGLALTNLGSSLTFDQDSSPLPRTLAAGVSYTGTWRDEDFTLAVDGRQPNDGSRSLSAGLELLTKGWFVARAGYSSAGDITSGLRLGAGIRFKTIQIDYAYAQEGVFGNAQRFGITLRFAAPQPNPALEAQRWYDKGVHEFHKGHYHEAMSDLGEALKIDPDLPGVVDMEKKVYEKLKQDVSTQLLPE